MVWILLIPAFLAVFGTARGGQQVYVSNGTHVLSYSRAGGAWGGNAVSAILGKAGYRIVGLAADIRENYLFWSDISADYKGIYRSNLNGENVTCIIKDVGEVDGLTVDWVSKHIYWTDVVKLTIEIANYDGSGRRILISSKLKTPKSIVAAPIFGYLFWVDQRGKRIERSWLDGTHRRTIIKSSDHWPNQMDISHQDERLYWVDAKSLAVFSCDLGGKTVKKEVKYRKITKGAPGFGLIVFENTAIISTWLDTGIYSILLGSKRTIWQMETKNLGTRELFHMVSLKPSTQPMTTNPCSSEDNGGCSHLCLPGQKNHYKCTCPTYGGLALAADGKTCQVPKDILLCSFSNHGKSGYYTNGDLGFVSLDTNWSREVTLISESQEPGAIAYDPVEQMVYWSDKASFFSSIYRVRLDGSEKSMVLNKSQGLGQVDGLAFDSETGLLYFTNFGIYSDDPDDSNYSWHRVEALNIYTNSRRTILRDVGKPTALVLDKTQQYLYIVDAGSPPRIIQTDLDGRNATTLNIPGLINPAGLVIVENDLMIYSRNDSMTSVLRYDRLTGETNITALENMDIGSVTAHDGNIYLTEIQNGQGRKVLLDNGTEIETFLEGWYPNSVLYSPSTWVPLHDHQTSCIRLGCSHDCVPLPKGQGQGEGHQYRCTCPEEAMLVLGEDGRTCTRPDNFILFTDAATIGMVSLDKGKDMTPVTLVNFPWGDFIDTVIYDETQDRIYWTGIQGNTLYGSRIEHLKPAIYYQEEGRITSVTLDTRKQKLFWTAYSDDDRGFIATLQLKRGLRSYKRIIKQHGKMFALTLHPNGKRLYWLEEGDGWDTEVRTCNSKGRRESYLHTLSGYPSRSMFVTDDTIYIGGAMQNIVELDIQGDELGVFAVTSFDVSGLGLLENLMFYTSLKVPTLTAVDMATEVVVTVAANLTRPSSVFVYHPDELTDECKSSYPCEEVCSPLPWGRYQCSCNEGKLLSSDKHTCIIDFGTTMKPTTPVPMTTTSSLGGDKVKVNSKNTPTPGLKVDNSVTMTTRVEPSPSPSPTSSTDRINTLSWDKVRSNDLGLDYVIFISTEKTTKVRDYAEPKPTTSTKKQDMRTKVMTFTESNLKEGRREQNNAKKSDDQPRIANCPSGEIIMTKLRDTDSEAEIPLKFEAYDANKKSLPVHCNYELTSTGLLVPWKGAEHGNQHDVVCKVIDSNQQTTTCSFTVVVKDIHPPFFTYCPSDLKVKQSHDSKPVLWMVPEAVDNVGVVQITGSHGPGHSFPPGETKVNYTAMDGAGNQAFCTFSVFVLPDKMCNLPEIKNGGVVCSHHGGSEDCSIVCETDYVVNPIRTFRRHFNCKHPDDIDALKKILATQRPCLESKYPSIIQQEFSLLFHGPINKHRADVMSRLTIAVTNQLVKEELCQDEICEIGNLSVPCDRDEKITNKTASTEDEEINLFSVNFNVTVRNDTKAFEEELDMIKLLQDIHKELMTLAALFKLELEEHKFQAIQDSLTSAEVKWLCPIGQISERDICIACPPGTFHNITLNICQYCGPSFYQDQQGQVTCKPCDPGHTAPDGATTKSLCHAIPSMDEMTLFVIVTACSFGVVFLCMAITLYLQFQRQQKRHQQVVSQKKTRYNMTPNIYVAPPPILKSKLDENLSPGQRNYSIDKKHPINIYNNHDYEEMDHSMSVYENDMYSTTPTQGHKGLRDYSPVEEIPTGTMSRENTFSTASYSPQFGVKRGMARSINTPSPGQQRKMSHDSTFSNQSPKMMRVQRTPTSDTPLITQSPLLRLKLAAYNLNHED